jgi:hypothetical protein
MGETVREAWATGRVVVAVVVLVAAAVPVLVVMVVPVVVVVPAAHVVPLPVCPGGRTRSTGSLCAYERTHAPVICT